jgi:hypothetical protein
LNIDKNIKLFFQSQELFESNILMNRETAKAEDGDEGGCCFSANVI